MLRTVSQERSHLVLITLMVGYWFL